MLNEDYSDMLRALSEEKVRYLLVGAYALAAHGYVRATMDINLWVMPDWDGIVTEAFGSLSDLINPLRLFGGPLRALPNMLRVGRHIATFIELGSMRNHLVSERVLMDDA